MATVCEDKMEHNGDRLKQIAKFRHFYRKEAKLLKLVGEGE